MRVRPTRFQNCKWLRTCFRFSRRTINNFGSVRRRVRGGKKNLKVPACTARYSILYSDVSSRRVSPSRRLFSVVCLFLSFRFVLHVRPDTVPPSPARRWQMAEGEQAKGVGLESDVPRPQRPGRQARRRHDLWGLVRRPMGEHGEADTPGADPMKNINNHYYIIHLYFIYIIVVVIACRVGSRLI